MNTIMNFIHVAKNVILHALYTATFCWVVVALVVAFLVIRGVKKKMENGDK